ncbi:MAG: winged helix-turn-helix domain-containing protein [Colwellia sp.]
MKNSNIKSISTSNNVINNPYYIEGIYVDPSQNIIVENNETRNVQPKVMEVLTFLCSKAEQLVSSDELIQACWPNQYISDSPVHKCIAQIRKTLADDPKSPRFIKTVPKKGYIFIAKVKGLHTRLHTQRGPWSGESPYPGLQPYTFTQSELFFGREQVITEINQWLAQINEHDAAWLSLTAPVGAGKSSLVHAGILPVLIPYSFIYTNQTDFCSVLDLALMPRSQKPHLHLLALLVAKEKLSTTQTVKNYADLLVEQRKNPTEEEPKNLFQSLLLAEENSARFVLFIDHVEQLFDNYSTLKPKGGDHASFFLLLQLLVTSKKCLLITATREQFQPNLTQTSLDDALAFHYKIPAFSHTELTDIIQKPAEITGVGFEYNKESRERLSSEMIQQLQNQSVPISSAQYLLSQLYAKKFDQQMTYNAYKKIGGIAGSIAAIAEQTYQGLTEQEQISFALILFRIITLNTNGQIATSEHPCPINHFVDKNKLSVINKFINVGIFQLTSKNEQTCVYLAHHSLLTVWPRIKAWIKTNISTLYLRHDLHVATQRWLYHEKSDDLFIRSNKKIKHLNDIIRCNDFDISDEEKTLIALSTSKLSRTNRIKNAVITTFFISFISLAWLSVTLVEKNNQIATTRDNAEDLISFILYDLKDKLEPLGKIELLNIVADKTVDYFTLAGTDHLSGKSLIQWVEALHILGDVNISKNNYTEAEAYFTQSLSALEQYDPNESNAKSLQNEEHEKLLELNMLANYWLGYSAYLQLDYQTTEPYWRNYLTYADTLALRYPKEGWKLEQSYALNNLGALAEKTEDLTNASDYFERSAQIKLSLLAEQPGNLTIRADLADTRSWQSNIHAKAGKLVFAIDSLQRSIAQIEKIYTIKISFKLTERMANLEHKIALLYYDNGDLTKALTYTNKAKNNIGQLINNDDKNYRFKEYLVWNHLLSVQILINQHQLDQALIYLNNARELIDQLKSSTTLANKIIRANIYLLHYQARTFALLNQPKSALVSITAANNLFKKHLTTKTDIALYACTVLTKLNILHSTNNIDKTIIENELSALIILMETQFSSTYPDFKALAAYFNTVKLIQQLQGYPPQLNNPWLQLYQESDYNIPYYSIISSMDSQ